MKAVRQLSDALLQEHVLSGDVRKLSFAKIMQAALERPRAQSGGACIVCRGLAGPVINYGELGQGQGYTFTTAHSFRSDVLELRQVTSTIHGPDLDTVPPMDAITVLERISKVEEFLLANANEGFQADADGRRGWLVVSKRRRPGRHGFQRMRFFKKLPAPKAGASFPAYLETHAPAEHVLGEFRGGLVAVIPDQPRCPFDTVIYFRPTARGRLCDLTGNQRWGLAQAIREVTGALRLELSVRGFAESYRWSMHAHPQEDLYVRVRVDPEVRVEDTPRDWAPLLRSHLGLE